MPNLLVAGNSTNGGTAITTDTSGTLNIVTGSGSGSNAITIDASQSVTMPGNLTVTGTLTASGGVSGGIRSGTAVTASGTSIDFTSLPIGLKRITVVLNTVSTNSTSNFLIQLGTSSGIETTGYESSAEYGGTAATATNGLVIRNNAASNAHIGLYSICLVSSNLWIGSGVIRPGVTGGAGTGGTAVGYKNTAATLDRVRITTVNGTDTFDAGSINILYE